VTERAPNFTVKAEVIRDSQGGIKFWRRSKTSREHYHVRIWIDGEPTDLDRVDQVDYLLHLSFHQQTRISKSRSTNFAIAIWTWGIFSMQLTLHMKDESKSEFDWFLNYDLPPDDGSNYVQVKSIE